MRLRFGSLLLLGALATTLASAKDTSSPQHLDAALMYAPVRSSDVTQGAFWMQGGAVQVHARLWNDLGVVADLSGSHIGNINASGVGLDLLTATCGPRLNWSPNNARLSVYGQGMVGFAHGFNGLFPASTGASTSDSGLAVLAGGGANMNLSHRIAARLFEVDWLRTQLPNATTDVENNVRFGFGIVLRIR